MENEDEEVDLSGCDAEYEKASVPDRENKNKPDGNYEATIERFYFAKVKPGSENAGTPMLCMMFRITGPSHENGCEFKNIMITNEPERLKWLKNDLYTLGFKDKISELQSKAELFIGLHVQIGLKSITKGDRTYQNVYINKLLTPF